MMNERDLATRLNLSTSAILLRGMIHEHKKSGMGAMTPHYASAGNPPVTESPADLKPYGAEIEFNLNGVRPPYEEALVGQSPKFFVQLIYGPKNIGPTMEEVEALIEASHILRQFVGREVYIAAIPILTTGMKTEGRLFPIGVFTLDGAPIYIEPRAGARGVLLKTPFPEGQKVRSLDRSGSASAATPAAQAAWFPALLKEAKSQDLSGDAAVKRALEMRALFLVDHGFGEAEARESAYNDYARGISDLGGSPIQNPFKASKKAASSSSASEAVLADLKAPRKPARKR